MSRRMNDYVFKGPSPLSHTLLLSQWPFAFAHCITCFTIYFLSLGIVHLLVEQEYLSVE